VPIIACAPTIAVGSREWLAADRMSRQSRACRLGAQSTTAIARNGQCWSLCVCRSRAKVRHGSSFARRHRPSSARGTSPKRNTAPQKLPHPQRADVEWKVAAPYAKSSSTLTLFVDSCRDPGIAALLGALRNRLVVLVDVMHVHEEILTDLPYRFLDTSQGSGPASRLALRFKHRARDAAARSCRLAAGNTAPPLYGLGTVRAAYEEG